MKDIKLKLSSFKAVLTDILHAVVPTPMFLATARQADCHPTQGDGHPPQHLCPLAVVYTNND